MIDVLLVVFATLLAIPSIVLLVECLLAPLARDHRGDDGSPPTFAVLVPAHDESRVVGATVRHLVGECGPSGRVLVVADNCTDDTAEVARNAGAEVVERQHDSDRGKGFALAFGARHLDQDPPDVVIVVDADCRLSPGGLRRLASQSSLHQRPVQAEYLMEPARDTPKSVISALAFLVRNRVRPRGMFALGLPCHLTGSGMAFPFEQFRNAPETGGWLVEDLLMGLELAKAGTPPRLSLTVEIKSVLPDTDRAARSQRTRWEHGQLATMIRLAPALMARGIAQLDVGLFALGLDLAVFPLALLVLLLSGSFAATATLALFGFTPFAPAICFAALTAVGVAVVFSWACFARDTIPLKALLTAPAYVAWKIPMYLKLLIFGREKQWRRTERGGDTTERLEEDGG